MKLQEKPHIDGDILAARDEFGFCHHSMVKPDTQPLPVEGLFQGLAGVAYRAAANIKATTGRTPHCIRVSFHLVSLNRITRLQILLNISDGDAPGTFNIEVGDPFAWAKLPYVMKQFLN